MVPGRPDDVSYRIFEEPEPPRRRPSRRRRWLVATSASVLAAGALAAGASALTDSGGDGARPAGAGKAGVDGRADGHPGGRRGHLCHRGEQGGDLRERAPDASSLRY
jgi:nitrous oxide reductase